MVVNASPSIQQPLEHPVFFIYTNTHWVHKCFTMAATALYSSSKQTHCALVVCDSERVTVALHSTFWISTKVVTALFNCYMADATRNCCCLRASSMYTIQPCTSLQRHFIQSHICSACVVSCNLPPSFWAGSFMCYCGNTGVKQILKQESALKIDPGEVNSPISPAARPFNHKSVTLPLRYIPISQTV